VQPNAVTVIVLMGFARRAQLAALLVGRGWRLRTPAAIVADGSRPGQQVWRGTLQQLAVHEAPLDSDAPAVLVIGDVAALNVWGAAPGAAGDLNEAAR